MGGIIEVRPERTIEEITARLIEISKLPQPKIMWVVEDPHLGYTKLEDIFYSTINTHIEMFPYSGLRLERDHITFYAHEHMEDAKRDALQRLARYLP